MDTTTDTTTNISKSIIEAQRERANRMFPYWRELVEYIPGISKEACERMWLMGTIRKMQANEERYKINMQLRAGVKKERQHERQRQHK